MPTEDLFILDELKTIVQFICDYMHQTDYQDLSSRSNVCASVLCIYILLLYIYI